MSQIHIIASKHSNNFHPTNFRQMVWICIFGHSVNHSTNQSIQVYEKTQIFTILLNPEKSEMKTKTKGKMENLNNIFHKLVENENT